ncbi:MULTISPECIES: SLOG family protein [unclassified Microbacterium]|uniref:SLOG family protein n=1 Tax=unclassified Microbacterium TaxID=2609290 RepID=UPI002882D9CD|nr:MULTISPECIES: SLOG family protein [unclassified Microbacterium]
MSAVTILMTGSRDWSDAQASTDALNAGLALIGNGPARLRHGAARGADTLVAAAAAELGFDIEAVPAQWNVHTEKCPEWDRRNATCKLAGHRRNSAMIAAGADLCLAFPTHGIQLAPGEDPKNTSRGTWDCATKAKEAGIPTLVVWGRQFFPFGDRGAELLQRDAAQKRITLGPAGSMMMTDAWLPF